MSGEILTNITTPLALAGLCVLGATGFIKAVAVKRDSKTLRLAIHWGFILALTMGVLANISFLVTSSFSREVRIAGTVRDDTGSFLSRAVVDIPGRGRGITDDYGSFEFSIPDSRKSTNYEGVVSLAGYKPSTFELKGPVPSDMVNVTISKYQIIAEEVILRPEHVLIGHYLGIPTVNLKLNLFNPLPADLALGNLSFGLVSPNGKHIELTMVGKYADSGFFVPGPSLNIDLDQYQRFSTGYRFMQTNLGLNGLMTEAMKEHPQSSQMPKVGDIIFTESMSKRFKDFMNQNMIWVEGEWRINLKLSHKGKSVARDFWFSISSAEIEKLKSVSRFYRTGHSVLPGLPNAPDGSSNLTVSIKN